MSAHYPFDANGNLLPGLTVVGGQIISAAGQVIPEAAAPTEQSVAVKPAEPEADTLSPEPAVAPAADEPETHL